MTSACQRAPASGDSATPDLTSAQPSGRKTVVWGVPRGQMSSCRQARGRNGALAGTAGSGAIAFPALWEAAVYVSDVPRYIVPAPSANRPPVS